MSLRMIHEIFNSLPECEEWNAYLLKFKHSKKQGMIYNCRKIELEPFDRINALIQDISDTYTCTRKNRLEKYTDVREYDGTCNGTTVYRISEDNPNIKIDLDTLFDGIADSDSESDPFEMKAQAYILCGQVEKNDEIHQVKLISMNMPITTLKNRFFHNAGKFYDISDKVLNWRVTTNVVIYDRTIYFLDMAGETLFNMERAYKIKCLDAVEEIVCMNIVTDSDMFRITATSGPNPRRFAAFSKSKLQLLSKRKNREKVAEYLKIPLTSDRTQFDTREKKDAESLVKILCGKAMWDILEEIPVEVNGIKNWVG